MAVLNEFIKKEHTRIRNKCAFLHRIIQRVQVQTTAHPNGVGIAMLEDFLTFLDIALACGQEEQLNNPNDKSGPNLAAQPPPPPPQRSRASSDIGCNQKRDGPSTAQSMAPGVGDYSQPKGYGGWAEKENGGQAYGCNGILDGHDLGADSFHSPGDLISSECLPRRHVDNVTDYFQTRHSLQLPGTYRQGQNSMVDARYRDGSGGAVPPQQGAGKMQGKEVLSAAAGAAAGSRLLAMLQGGQPQQNITAQQPGRFGHDRMLDRPPLFARATAGSAGGAAVREGGASGLVQARGNDSGFRVGGFNGPYRGVEDEELLAMIARGQSYLGQCTQCGNEKFGDVDTSDGHFYCEDCWKAFESSRTDSALLVYSIFPH